eukprot:scaffold9729_cov108-Isochrysis_galbana.AAC.6
MSVTPSPSTSTASSYALVSTVAWTARSRARIFLFSSAIRALSSALRRTRSCMASLRALRNSFSATFGSFPLRSDLSSAFSRRIRSDSAAFNRAMCSAYFSLSSSVASGPNGPSCRRTARLGRALGFLPAQSSTAALYTPLNSSKLEGGRRGGGRGGEEDGIRNGASARVRSSQGQPRAILYSRVPIHGVPVPELAAAIHVVRQKDPRRKLYAVALQPPREAQVVEHRQNLLHVNAPAPVVIAPVENLPQLLLALFRDADRLLIVLRATSDGWG